MTEEARRRWQERLDYLLEQEPILTAPAQRFELDQQIKECRAKLAELAALSASPPPDGAGAPPRIDLHRLPAGTRHFFGRDAELAALDAAWAGGATPAGIAPVAIVETDAAAGTGKTALTKRWLEGLMARGWGGAGRVFGWSFYSQGTRSESGADRQASEDLFLATALDWFGVPIDPAAHPADKGQALAEALTCQPPRQPTLLVLDGLEPLQHPPGPLAGELRAPGLKALLAHLASAGRPGLCLLTTRERVADLDEWVRGDTRPGGPVLRLDLDNLSDTDGARLLHALGTHRAGAAVIGPDDAELIAASRAVRGHALTLSLLGNYLRLAHGGDCRRRDRVDLGAANAATGGHAFRVIAAYERWLGQGGAPGAQALAALRLLGLFDRPATPEHLAVLRAAPPIPGLTEPLFDAPAARPGAAPDGAAAAAPPPQPMTADAWAITLTRLQDAGLIAPARLDGDGAPGSDAPGSVAAVAPGPDAPAPRDELAPIDAHPLVREYLAAALAERCPDAWREGHRRLYERLKTSAPHRPDDLAGLQPLYQAVAHGCQAGLWQEVCTEVYQGRILRWPGDDVFYSINKLGAFGADLGAVACLFAEPWSRPAPALKASDQAWLLNEAAFRLRALGRLGEALAPMRAVAEIDVKQQDWKNAAISYGTLSELQLTLGRVADAVADARRAVEYADRSGDAFMRMAMRTTLADALHQQGETAPARAAFAEAEAMQAAWQPQYPRLYSLQGFRYCDLLLAAAERAAWCAVGRGDAGDDGAVGGAVGGGAVGSASSGADGVADADAAGATETGAGGAGVPAGPAADCAAVAARAQTALNIVMRGSRNLLDIGLNHLTLARCALYADRLAGRPPGAEAQDQTARALDGLRAAGRQDILPLGLLTRAWLRHALGDPNRSRADLAESERIASRGGMALHLADTALHRARLFQDRAALTQARDLIATHHYARRLPELADAEAAAADWPAPSPDP